MRFYTSAVGIVEASRDTKACSLAILIAFYTGNAGTCPFHSGFLLVAHIVRGEIAQANLPVQRQLPFVPTRSLGVHSSCWGLSRHSYTATQLSAGCKCAKETSSFLCSSTCRKYFGCLANLGSSIHPQSETKPFVLPEHPLPLRQYGSYSLAVVPC